MTELSVKLALLNLDRKRAFERLYALCGRYFINNKYFPKYWNLVVSLF